MLVDAGLRTLAILFHIWTSKAFCLVMAQIIFDDQKLNKARYDVHNPLDAARFQRNVMEFIDLIRNTVVGGKLSDESNNNNRHLVNEFCRFVDDKKVWHLAQMVIPKFRSSLVKQ